MQHDQKSVREQSSDQDDRVQGPVELDPALFGLVSGGSPRNGWSSSTTLLSTSETDSPRNGWQ